jgi:hypothetical protein
LGPKTARFREKGRPPWRSGAELAHSVAEFRAAGASPKQPGAEFWEAGASPRVPGAEFRAAGAALRLWGAAPIWLSDAPMSRGGAPAAIGAAPISRIDAPGRLINDPGRRTDAPGGFIRHAATFVKDPSTSRRRPGRSDTSAESRSAWPAPGARRARTKNSEPGSRNAERGRRNAEKALRTFLFRVPRSEFGVPQPSRLLSLSPDSESGEFRGQARSQPGVRGRGNSGRSYLSSRPALSAGQSMSGVSRRSLSVFG